MPENYPLRLLQNQTQILGEAVESWQAEHQEAMQAFGLEELVEIFTRMPELVGDCVKSIWRRLKRNQVHDYRADGEVIRKMLADTINLGHVLCRGVQGMDAKGYSIAGGPTLVKALERLEKMRKEFESGWPDFSSQDLLDAQVEGARGELLDLDDAFAAIAGVDRESWLKHIEAHNSRKGGA